MARRYLRRYSRRSTRRSGRSYRRGTSRLIKSIKKDTMHVNFPKKIKLIYLPERKTMFLKHSEQLVITHAGTPLVLYPTKTENIESIINSYTFKPQDGTEVTTRLGNWDKYCVERVYIQIQPKRNNYDGDNDTSSIFPISCFYALNNNVAMPADANQSMISQTLANTYDNASLKYKHLFTFNSNESFTFVLETPSTMSTDSPKIHGKRAWWSLADQQLFGVTDGQWKANHVEMEDDGVEDDVDIIDENLGVINSPFLSRGLAPAVHCGRLYFAAEPQISTGVTFNITLNYKVSLRG